MSRLTKTPCGFSLCETRVEHRASGMGTPKQRNLDHATARRKAYCRNGNRQVEYSKASGKNETFGASMRRTACNSIAVVAAIGAILSPLAVPSIEISAGHAVRPVRTSASAMDTIAAVSAVIRAQRNFADCTQPHNWLESRSEEENKLAVAIEANGASPALIDTPTFNACVALSDFGRHLAWNPSTRAFSPSVHPLRC